MTHHTLKNLPPKVRPTSTPKGTTTPLTPTMTALAEPVQELVMAIIDQAVTRYLVAVEEEKRWKEEDPTGDDCPYEIAYLYDQWCNLRSEAWTQADKHLARVIQYLRGDVGPSKLNRMGFNFIPCGMRYGDHYFFCVIPDDEVESGDFASATVKCIPIDDVVDPVTEGVRL